MKPAFDYTRMSELIEAEKNKIGLRELARKLEIPPASLHDYLSMGVEPRLSALQKMSRYFDVTIAELMGEIDAVDAEILKVTRGMNQKQKQALLKELKK